MPPTSQTTTSPLFAAWSPAARRVLAIAVGALLMTLAARVALPVPGTAVPLTLQDLTALALGGVLGPVAGAGALVAYLGLGAMGLPVFAGGGGTLAYLLGPTGGYLMAFPLAAWTAGALSGRVSPARALLGAMCGMVVIHAGGVAWLALQTGDGSAALRLGSLPFVATGLVKAALAAGLTVRLAPRFRPGQ